MTEFELIERLCAQLPTNSSTVVGAGDDCAVLDLGLPDRWGKSAYVQGLQCPKLLWHRFHEPEAMPEPSVLTEAGLKVIAEGENQCDFRFSSFEAFWRAHSSAGNYQPVLQAVGQDRLRQIVGEAVRAYTRTDGTIVLRNVYRWTAGHVAP